MCITFNVKITFEIRRLFGFLKSYEDCFNSKNTKTLLEYENKNHVIDSIFDAKPLYKSLYILSEIKFDVLKNYLLKNLILSRIQKFTSRANALMFFVFKKNDNL